MGLFGWLLAAVLAAAAAVFGLQQFTAATAAQNAAETQQLIVKIAGDIQSTWRTQPNYGAAGDDLTEVAIGLGIIPPDYAVDDENAESPFGEPLVITAQLNRFDIEVQDIDDDECEALLEHAWRRGELRTIEIAAVAAQNPDDIDPADINAACVAGDGANDITFQYR